MAPVSTPQPDGSGPAPASPSPDLDAEYRQAREECALHQPGGRAWLEITGPDAAEYLHSQVTNDIENLAPGDGCYALLLDRKGHLQAEMRILMRAAGRFLVETGSDQLPGLSRHLGMYKIGRKVEVQPVELDVLSLIGPATAEVSGIAPGPEHSFAEAEIAGAGCLAVATDAGLDLICSPDLTGRIRSELLSRHAIPVSDDAVEILRVESGRPRFGQDMDGSRMPAEAGLVERAVNFEKGCYIGQEPVARLHYRGKPNRRLRGLVFDGPVVPGDPVRLGDRELGTVGTAVISPARGRIGLAILRREAEPDVTVTVMSDGDEIEARVIELPFDGDPR